MNVQLRDFTYFVAVSIMIGWLLHIGKPVLLPVLIAMIVVYVLSAAAQRMQSIPILGRLPGFARRALVLFLFAIGMLLLTLPGESERLSVTGQVIWISPEGVSGRRMPGIGVHFSQQDYSVRDRIETLLAGQLDKAPPSFTL